jgi:GNAT superfamily N-acetyltransferase
MKATLLLQIISPATDEQYEQARNLIRAFIDWHRLRHEGTTLTNDYYGHDEFEQELASLPNRYGSGRNRLLLACYGGQPTGCVALRELDNETCEMKRMFVYEQYQGKGIGRALAQALITEAKNMGYTFMKLNTGIRQVEAQKLYESLGFKRTAPYYTMPKKLEEWLVFMALKL